MKIVFALSLLLLLSTPILSQRSPRLAFRPSCGQFVYERLRNYFEINEERPLQVVNNKGDLGRWESKIETLRIGEQTVEWIDEVSGNSSRSSVRINGELISLDKQTTLNAPDEDQKFRLDMVGQWDQIKLWELGEQTIIAIAMSPRACTGLMCGVGVQLWYDVKSKQKTYFGTYRTDSDVSLFRYPRGNSYYVVGTNFKGDFHGLTAPIVITYELFGLAPNGQFKVRTNPKGVKYFIRHTTFAERELTGETVTRRRVQKEDSLEQNWLEDVLAVNQ
ncbi:MAG: hypothetical protein ABI791_11920 [Acidobacteriota bacterium]